MTTCLPLQFLDWNGPFLPRVAEYLCERYTAESVIDLSNVIVVTPGSRSGRRLLEILVGDADRLVIPPTFALPGNLAEMLYESRRPLAMSLAADLARYRALREAPPAILRSVAPQPPEPDDVASWMTLAAEVGRLSDGLAGDGCRIEDVLERCRRTLDKFGDEKRWRALVSLEESYLAILESEGLSDRNAERAAAVAEKRCRTEREIVLAGTAELPLVVVEMLDAIEESGAVIPLVFAPQTEVEAFDRYGRIIAEKWFSRRVPLDGVRTETVDRPDDQAFAAARILAEVGGDYAPDEITIGLGDAGLAPVIERRLAAHSVAARSAEGSALASSNPGQLIKALLEYAASRRLDDLATLVRHPDFETFLLAKTSAAAEPPAVALDRYFAETFQRGTPTAWPSSELAGRIRAVHSAVEEFLPGTEETRSLSAWGREIAGLLAAIFASRDLARHRPDDHAMIEALSAIANALSNFQELAFHPKLDPVLCFTDSLRLLALHLENASLPAPAGETCVEMLGWLEVPLDDAPLLVIAGFNEGNIPERPRQDGFLPDSVREKIGLTSSRSRFARDLYHLTAIIRSRPNLAIISGRRGTDDNPLLPSRLFLRQAPEDLPDAIRRFYEHGDSSAAPPLIPHGSENLFGLPLPNRTKCNSLRVTAFKDYLTCPYRFYLKHVLDLRGVDPDAEEIDQLQFGNIIHDVLMNFGQNKIRDSIDSNEIFRYLTDRLDHFLEKRYSADPGPIVALQRDLLIARLESFARWQATERKTGWTIVDVEKKLQWKNSVNGEPFTVEGRIDRIERLSATERRVMDYKTSQTAKKPNQTHLKNGNWVDLQLPLYRELFEAYKKEAGFSTEPGAVTLQLGYVSIAASGTGSSIAEWDDAALAEARATAEEVMHRVHAGEFWPPGPPAGSFGFDDPYASICMDRYVGRPEAIRRGSNIWSEGS